ncbi:hypothetical protein ACFX13_031703 [Malus domestica]
MANTAIVEMPNGSQGPAEGHSRTKTHLEMQPISSQERSRMPLRARSKHHRTSTQQRRTMRAFLRLEPPPKRQLNLRLLRNRPSRRRPNRRPSRKNSKKCKRSYKQ